MEDIGSIHSFAYIHFFPTSFLEETILSPFYIFGALVEDYLAVYVWIYSLVLCSVTLFYASTILFQL